MFPQIAAPGVNVNTADLSFGGLPFYVIVSGTSYAAPHVAGTMALLMSAFPAASVQALETALNTSATDLAPAGADYATGYGLLNAKAAYQLLAAGGSPPVITSTPVTTATPGVAYSYAVTATDASGSALTFTLDVAPAGMSIDASAGLITWTPTAAQIGPNAVTVRVTNAAGLSSLQSFTITVASLNQPPVAADDAYTILQGMSLAMSAPGVLANDSDPNATAITAVLVAGPAHGTLTLSANGSFIYTPTASYSGADTFTYRAYDGSLYSNVATVRLTITPDRAPLAANDSYTVLQGTTLAVAAAGVLANDSDPDGTAITAVLRTGPSHGTLTLNGNGSFTYKPAASYSGPDSFIYRAYDGTLYSANATVTITVTANQAPVANNDSVTAPARGSGSYTPVVIAVLANDTDANGNIDPATVTITTATNKGGTATVNANGTVSYVPKANFHGVETFKYKVRDTSNVLSNAATVTVTVP
jgi:VCBS repeat-containing protein